MDIILVLSVYFKICLPNFDNIMVRQFQCASTTYGNSVNERFSSLTFFHKLLNFFFMFQCNEQIEMNKFLCSLACTWM